MAKQKKDFKISPSKLQGVLSITTTEFEKLLPFFEASYDYYFKRFTLTGKVRERYHSSNSNNKVFLTAEDALFFILFYMKGYPTEEHMALTFSMTQPQVNQWKQVLQQVLKECFEKLEVLPARNTKDLNRLLQKLEVTTVIVDATERAINRPKDNEVQKDF
jgi:hypothetical protein